MDDKIHFKENELMPMKINQDHFRGCLIGGVIGDAFGSPVEFLQYGDIRSIFGEAGITDLVCGALHLTSYSGHLVK